MKLRLSALALGTTLLVGCASSGTDQQGRSDPLEGFNRTMYNFNFNVLDPYIVRPVAVAWRDYVPQPARNGLSNFTGNLEEPAVMVNYFLQGDPYQGMVHFTRFFLFIDFLKTEMRQSGHKSEIPCRTILGRQRFHKILPQLRQTALAFLYHPFIHASSCRRPDRIGKMRIIGIAWNHMPVEMRHHIAQ